MDNQEILNILSPYLPYNLRMLDSIGRIKYLRGISLNATSSLFVRLNDKDVCVSLGGLPKLILRPLSDLLKWVDYGDGHGLVKLGHKYGIVFNDDDEDCCYCQEVQANYAESPTALIPINYINTWLYEYHFDVNNLIGQGFAIDINTLESEVKNG